MARKVSECVIVLIRYRYLPISTVLSDGAWKFSISQQALLMRSWAEMLPQM